MGNITWIKNTRLKMIAKEVLVCGLVLSMVIAVSWAVPADVECAEWEEVDDGTDEMDEPVPTAASIGMCSCSRGFYGNYVNWESCGEGYSPDTWWSLFRHCWCRCCSKGEEEGECGDWEA